VDLVRVLPGVVPGLEDELSLLLERELVSDLALSALGTWSRDRFTFAPSPELVPHPTLPLPIVERDVAALTLGLRKVPSRRWAADAGWTFTPRVPVAATLLADPGAPFVTDFLSAYRRHRLSASASWDLPTDPWTLSVGGFARWASAVSPGSGRWWLEPSAAVGGSVSQAIHLRKGALQLRAAVAHAANDTALTALPLEALALVPGAPPIGEEPPFRVDAEMSYAF
jgi:hypothetical protein